MMITDFKPFVGVHCETTTTGTMLKNLGIDLSEPMLFGLGESLGYIFWNMKFMDFPFIGGRIKQGLISQNLAKNLKLNIDVQETASIKKAWKNVQSKIDQGSVVGLQLDCFHLDYFDVKIHFAGHFAALYGYDDEFAYMVDTKPTGGVVKTSLKNLELARSEKGPMSAKNLSYTITKSDSEYCLESAVRSAIKCNADDFLNPPIKNIGYKGILKTSAEIKKWFHRSTDLKHEFSMTAMLMSQAGTGGALFRNLYRDFLSEATSITGSKHVESAHQKYCEIANKWDTVVSQIEEVSKTNQESIVNEISIGFKELSELEYAAMKELSCV